MSKVRMSRPKTGATLYHAQQQGLLDIGSKVEQSSIDCLQLLGYGKFERAKRSNPWLLSTVSVRYESLYKR